MADKRTTVGGISLGCDKNRVDTEHVLASLVGAGYGIVDLAHADIILVNTCAFIESAKNEAIDAILDGIEYKKQGAAALVVMGCFAERYAQEVAKDFPEVDAFVSIGSYPKIVEIFNALPKKTQFCKKAQQPWFPGRVQTTPPHYAYLKIADGCNNRCTYCAIPMIRGAYRSEPKEELLKEAAMLAENSVKELIVVAQDTTRYGEDLYGGQSIVPLLKELVQLPFRYVRLLYAYPERVTDELLAYIESEPKMVKYLDVPLQHISDRVLKSMARRTTKADILSLLARIKNIAPSVKVRSSFIVGFPGETDAEYEELKEFISAGHIDYGGFFAYSKEEGTPAERMEGQLPLRIKRNRKTELEKLEQAVVIKKHHALEGEVISVFYEGIDFKKGFLYGRPVFAAPEIDATVYLTAKSTLNVGEVYLVRITEGGFYMKGEVVGND